jgi:hypothetical protein
LDEEQNIISLGQQQLVLLVTRTKDDYHYDNAGTDVGEGVEIAGYAGIDLTGWSLFHTMELVHASRNLSGNIPEQLNGYNCFALFLIYKMALQTE